MQMGSHTQPHYRLTPSSYFFLVPEMWSVTVTDHFTVGYIGVIRHYEVTKITYHFGYKIFKNWSSGLHISIFSCFGKS